MRRTVIHPDNYDGDDQASCQLFSIEDGKLTSVRA
jgi:hypothetical protein